MEEEINLLKGAAFEFGDVEITPDRTEKAGATKNEADLPFEIRLVWVDHVRNDNIHDGAKYSLASCGKTDCFGTERWCRNLSKQSKCSAADRGLVDERIDHSARGLHPTRGRSMDNVKNAHEHQDYGHTDHSPDEELPAAKRVDGHPCYNRANHTTGRDSNTEIEGVAGGYAS